MKVVILKEFGQFARGQVVEMDRHRGELAIEAGRAADLEAWNKRPSFEKAAKPAPERQVTRP